MSKKTAIFAAFFSLLALSVVVSNLRISPQDNSKNTIRILFDHTPPVVAKEGQSLDVFAKKFLPLFNEEKYSLENFIPAESFDLIPPPNPSHPKPKLHFEVVRDEVTRTLLFLKGDADVLYDTVAIAKTVWLQKEHSHEIQVIEAPGLTLSFLGFNFKSPYLSKLPVRRAIASALPVDDWIRYKLFNWVNPVSGLNLPHYDPSLAIKTLDEAGYPIQADGFRFHLVYYTTPVREGNELARLVREALKKIQIDVEITTLETSLYFDKIKKGDFDLMSSVWRPFHLQDSLADFLSPDGTRNYFHYRSPQSEALFKQNTQANWAQVKPLLESELPFFPLYFWKHGLVISKRLTAPTDLAHHIDETFRFLSELDLK